MKVIKPYATKQLTNYDAPPTTLSPARIAGEWKERTVALAGIDKAGQWYLVAITVLERM
jgi:hypothetical protein